VKNYWINFVDGEDKNMTMVFTTINK